MKVHFSGNDVLLNISHSLYSFLSLPFFILQPAPGRLGRDKKPRTPGEEKEEIGRKIQENEAKEKR